MANTPITPSCPFILVGWITHDEVYKARRVLLNAMDTYPELFPHDDGNKKKLKNLLEMIK